MDENEQARPAPVLLSDGTEVKPQLYIQKTCALYKVSTVYPAENRFTATVCFDHSGDLPGRTTVRGLTREQAARWKPASAQVVSRYHQYLDRGRS
jgi:hypothetical protein